MFGVFKEGQAGREQVNLPLPFYLPPAHSFPPPAPPPGVALRSPSPRWPSCSLYTLLRAARDRVTRPPDTAKSGRLWSCLLPLPGADGRPLDPLVETGVSGIGLAMEGGLVRFASGSSGIRFPSPFHDPSPPSGDNAARLSARVARPMGSLGAGIKGSSTSSSPAASQGVEVANGTPPTSSLARLSQRGIVLVGAGGGEAADKPLAAPSLVSADQIECGALPDLLGRRGGDELPPLPVAGHTFGMAPVDAAAAAAVPAAPAAGGGELTEGAARPAGDPAPVDFPAPAGPGPVKANGRRSHRFRVHLLQKRKRKEH